MLLLIMLASYKGGGKAILKWVLEERVKRKEKYTGFNRTGFEPCIQQVPLRK